MANQDWQALAKHAYMSLATFKKNGDKVAVPVWLAAESEAIYVWTNSESFKVKRLRNNPACELTPCNANGKKLLGKTVKGKASFLSGAEMERGENLIKAKYGWQFHLIKFINKHFRGVKQTTVIKILPA